MDIEQNSSSAYHIEEEEQLQLEPIKARGQRGIVINTETAWAANSIINKRVKHTLLGLQIDKQNSAQRSNARVRTKDIDQFSHFMTKNSNKDQLIDIMNEVRSLATQKGVKLNGSIRQKLEQSTMVVRVISKQQNSDCGIIQDQSGQEKIAVKNAIIWVGMIICISVRWTDGAFKLDSIYDLGEQRPSSISGLKQVKSAYRMLFVKGPFSEPNSADNVGARLLAKQLEVLKSKQNIRIDCVVILGPLLSIKNTAICSQQLSFDEQAISLIKLLVDQVQSVVPQCEIVLLPSTQDVTNIYPIPQTRYSYAKDIKKQNLHFASNPTIINIQGRQSVRIDVVDSDIRTYIDQNKIGRVNSDLLQEQLITMFKQPFLLTNTLNQPFDQTNLSKLYNRGKFGDIVVTSSEFSPPLARQVRGKVFLNIGSLGLEPNYTGKHYITMVSIFQGEGNISSRIKVEYAEM